MDTSSFDDELEGVQEQPTGKEWDTLTLFENSPVLQGIEWTEEWGDQLSIKVCRVLYDGGGDLGGAWFITEVLNAFEEEIELPLSISDVIEEYLENKDI